MPCQSRLTCLSSARCGAIMRQATVSYALLGRLEPRCHGGENASERGVESGCWREPRRHAGSWRRPGESGGISLAGIRVLVLCIAAELYARCTALREDREVQSSPTPGEARPQGCRPCSRIAASLWRIRKLTWRETLRPILVLAMLLPPYLCDPCSCGVLTRCGMGYQAPQVVCSHGTPRLPPLYGTLSGVLV